MRAKNLSILERISLTQLEVDLNRHTLDRIPVDQWTAFSWSISRRHMFERCKRQYYLNYYGARRVREAKSEVVSAVWWLKQVVGMKAWLGTVIHYAAGEAVMAHRDGRSITRDALVDLAVRYYRDGVQASRRGIKHDGMWVILFPDVYPEDEPDLGIEEAGTLVETLVDSLLGSEGYAFATGQPASTIYEIDEPFQSFMLKDVPKLGEVKTFAIPDVLLHDGETIQIIDWKTGSVEVSSIRDQAGIYRLYAHHRYGLPGDQIGVLFAALGDDGSSVEAPGGTPSVEEARALAYDSILEMTALMDNVEYNTVAVKNFPRTDDLSLCQQCGFKRACWRHE